TPPDARSGQPRGEQVHLRIGDRGSLHEILLSGCYFILGSRASRTPSPKNVNASMVIAMAIDGNTHRCQYERMYCWPSPTIWPHDGVGGLIPTPMNDSAASVKIACGIPNVTATTMGVSALGSTWRNRSRPAREPNARAPSTDSFCLVVCTCARA